MSRAHGPMHGRSPWQANRTGEVPYERPAPRQLAPYTCTRGHEFTVTFAANVTPPPGWDCRCGAPAGPVERAGGETDRERCMRLLLMRRSPAELEQLLARRLAEIRGQA
jgi:RNA polymerase-binding protein